MSFNFKSYTANNPLLQEVEESDNLQESNYWNIANKIAKKKFGEFGFASLSGDQMANIVNIKKAGDHLENFRSELASAHAMASQSGQKEWVSALNKIALRLDALEGAMAEANAKLGVLPTK